MNILLTNDDGIFAPGLAAIYKELVDPNFEYHLIDTKDLKTKAGRMLFWREGIGVVNK